jgi:hypothetical protein
VPPDSVRCTRTVQLQTSHLWVSKTELRYNSSDCPVCHRTVRCAKQSNSYQRNGRLQRTPANATVRVKVRADARGASGTEQCMSGATRRQSSNGRPRPNLNGGVTWLVSGAPIDSSHPQRLFWWFRAINTPNHLHSNYPSIHHFPFNTRAKCNTPRHNSKPSIRSKSPIQF